MPESVLDAQGQLLLVHLVRKLPAINPKDPRTFSGYKEIHVELGLQLLAETYGQSLQKQGLDALSRWLADRGMPALTGIVIDVTAWTPGKGFFSFFGKRSEDLPWWISEVTCAKAYDWTDFAGDGAIAEPPEPVDLRAPPGGEEITVVRVIRDTPLARRIKQLHKFECQLCGLTITLSNGQRYAEAHHIQPLGTPHNGPDIQDNIICVCPNHHAELDYGVRRLEVSEIRATVGHAIDQRYLTYHNTEVCGRKTSEPRL